MNVTVAPTAVGRLTSDFLSQTHGHLIGDAWVPAKSGRTFPVYNPADGTVIANVAFGDVHDIDAAVDSARRALNGPRCLLSPAEGAGLLFKLADLIEAQADEIALIDTLDNGKPFSAARSVDLESA